MLCIKSRNLGLGEGSVTCRQSRFRYLGYWQKLVEVSCERKATRQSTEMPRRPMPDTATNNLNGVTKYNVNTTYRQYRARPPPDPTRNTSWSKVQRASSHNAKQLLDRAVTKCKTLNEACANRLSGNGDRVKVAGRNSQVQSPKILRNCAANPATRYP